LSVRFQDSPEFERLLGGAESPNLLRIALELARDVYPELEIEPYLDKVCDLADRIRARCASLAQPRKILGQINWALFVEEGFHGNRDDYYDPRNSYLNEVIDRKTGIPISLSVLYRALAERLGLKLEGANLPAHFMLQLSDPAQPLFIDVFNSGDILDRDGCERRLSEQTGQRISLSDSQLAPCPARAVVARMLRNLKAVTLGTHDFPTALHVQRRLAAVALEDPVEQRDLGMICLRLDLPGEAIDPLEAYLRAAPTALDACDIADLLKNARRLIARWN
jgi:regulator of sirC expression with transglutaminase-like and TPR domain